MLLEISESLADSLLGGITQYHDSRVIGVLSKEEVFLKYFHEFENLEKKRGHKFLTRERKVSPVERSEYLESLRLEQGEGELSVDLLNRLLDNDYDSTDSLDSSSLAGYDDYGSDDDFDSGYDDYDSDDDDEIEGYDDYDDSGSSDVEGYDDYDESSSSGVEDYDDFEESDPTDVDDYSDFDESDPTDVDDYDDFDESDSSDFEESAPSGESEPADAEDYDDFDDDEGLPSYSVSRKSEEPPPANPTPRVPHKPSRVLKPEPSPISHTSDEVEPSRPVRVSTYDVPTNLRDFLKEHPNCSMVDALRYFPKREIERQIRLGRIVLRHGKLSL